MRPIPDELRARYDELSAERRETQEGVIFEMHEVGLFCQITGDPNVIHTERFPFPVLPGFLELSSLGRYMESRPPIFIEGYKTLLTDISAHFKQMVRVGTPLSLRYLPTSLETDEFGPKVDGEFAVIRTGTDVVILTGKITFRFIPDRVFNALVVTAVR